MITGSFTFGTAPAGDHWIQWTCGGWVAINPTASVDPRTDVAATQTPITLHAVTTVEAQDAESGPFGTTAQIFFSLSSPQYIHTQVHCVDPRVFGETFPVAAPVAHPAVSVH